jgi:hypothetical protein
MSYTAQNMKQKVQLLLKVGKDLPSHDLADHGKDYIDYLGFDNNLITNDVMRGIDGYTRFFFVFKIIIHIPGQGPLFLMDTLFQRHRSAKFSWQVCGHYSKNTILTTGGIKPWQLQFYIDLLTEGRAKITEKIRPVDENHIGCIATLGNVKDWKSSKMIQRNWRKVRKDPGYYMCKRVQMRDAVDHGAGFVMKDLRELFPKWDENDFRKVFPELFQINDI